MFAVPLVLIHWAYIRPVPIRLRELSAAFFTASALELNPPFVALTLRHGTILGMIMRDPSIAVSPDSSAGVNFKYPYNPHMPRPSVAII